MTLTHGTDVTRPGLRLVTLESDSPGSLARAAVGLALGRLDRVPGVQDRAVGRVRLSGEAIHLQVDGDRLPAVDATVAASPAPLAVLAP
jgi:diacylglycerol kinase family enzyme